MKWFILFFLFSILSIITVTAQQTVSHPTGIMTCVQHDTSPPLRDMHMIDPSATPVEWEEGEVPNQNFMSAFEDENAAGLNREIDPVVQHEMGENPPVSTIVNIDGLGNLNWVAPADPCGDVGTNHYILTVNMSFAIYSKTGVMLYGPANLRTLWEGFVTYTGDGDPIVLYDHLADRWMVSQFALPNYPNGPFYELVAVSQTSDPLGPWHRYKFQFTDMPDYPKFGIWPDGYYLSVNTFSSGSLNWIGAGAAVLERDSMLTGNTARMVFFQQSTGTRAMTPADLDGPAPPAGAPGYFALIKEAPAGSGGDQINIFELHADWTNVTNSTFTGPQVISVAPFDLNMCGNSRNCIPQAGTTAKVDPVTGFIMHRLQYRNFGTHQVFATNHTVDVDGTDHAGVRWYELRNSGTGWSLHQQGSYAPDENHRWIASAAMDGQQNIALGFSVSGSALYPSIHATGRRSTDPPGLMTFLEEPVMVGTGSQTMSEGRWGDYSSLSIDPVDDETFWYTNQYYLNTSYDQWKTRIASFKISTLPVDITDPAEISHGSDLLLGNFPNPCDNSTTIKYVVREKGFTTLKVSDILGKEVGTLVDGIAEPGERSLVFNTSNLPEGVYFYQLQAGNSFEIRKMVVSR